MGRHRRDLDVPAGEKVPGTVDCELSVAGRQLWSCDLRCFDIAHHEKGFVGPGRTDKEPCGPGSPSGCVDAGPFRGNFLAVPVSDDDRPIHRTLGGVVGRPGNVHNHPIGSVAEVTEVSALTKAWTKDPSGAITDINDDTFLAIGMLENGATATFQASRAAAAHSLTSLIEIDGTKGSLSWGMERLNELTIRKPGEGPMTIPVLRPGHPYDGFWLPGGIQGSHPVGWNECFAHQAHDILALASGKKTESVAATFADGYRVAEIVDTIEQAALTGNRQTLKFRS